MYPFEAEGEHELDLEEGEVVDVKGRGGGEGWVVATKLVGGDGVGASAEGKGDKKKGKEGLVPESYLEKVDESEAEGIANAVFSSRTGIVHPIEEEVERDSEGHDGEANHESGQGGSTVPGLGLGGLGTGTGTGTGLGLGVTPSAHAAGESSTEQPGRGEAGRELDVDVDVPGEKGVAPNPDPAPSALPLPLPLSLSVPAPELVQDENDTAAHVGKDRSNVEATS
jgi:hypothetical protein